MQEIKKVSIKVPQAYLDFMNQIFEIEKKAANLKKENSIQRNLNKMKGILEEEFFKGSSTIGLTYHNPLDESYSDTRTDCEATISGTGNVIPNIGTEYMQSNQGYTWQFLS